MVDIEWRPSPKELRRFGMVVMVGMAIIGGGLCWSAESTSPAYVAWGIGAVIGLPALTGKAIALPGYWLWMGLAFVMGNIMSRLILGMIFFLIFTPIALARRALGADALQLERPPKGVSCWRDVGGGSAATGYERQF